MSNSKQEPIWYGEKTFKILKGFHHQGVDFYAGNLFTCNPETYGDYKKFLGEEYIQKSKEEKKEESKKDKEIKKEQGKKQEDKEDEKQTKEQTEVKKPEGHKIKDKKEEKITPKKRGIINRVLNK